MKWLAVLLVAVAVCGCIPQLDFGDMAQNPKRKEIEAAAALLPETEARELLVWHDNHDNVWDARVHSLDTCPILTYTPAHKRHEDGQMADVEWANFLHGFFEAKHDEEKDDADCDCDEQLGGCVPSDEQGGRRR